MSKALTAVQSQTALKEFSTEQIDLIKATVAKGASDSELKLFLYRCQNMGLDPLKPGQVHFIKYGSNPGSIVVGIDGFRSLAARTGKQVGTKRGLLRDDNNKCIGAWCEIYRKDWEHPAREEVSMAEYNTGKAQWLKMPETMIKKVAEAAALRMAFPDDLGGIYADEEMDQAGPREVTPTKAAQVNQLLETQNEEIEIELEEPDFITDAAAAGPSDLGSYVIPIGKKYKGKRLDEMHNGTLADFANWVRDNVVVKSGETLKFLNNVDAYLKEQEV